MWRFLELHRLAVVLGVSRMSVGFENCIVNVIESGQDQLTRSRKEKKGAEEQGFEMKMSDNAKE